MTSKANTVAQLNALVDLISTSLKEVVEAYARAGCDIPSLDSTETGPFDVPENTPLELTKAIQVIEGACGQLCAAVAAPGHVVTNKAYAYHESTCLQVAVSAKLSDLLLDKPDGVSVEDLSKASGVEAGKLGRIMRLLATRHVYREVRPNVYANNRTSMKLLSKDPVNGLIGHVTDENLKGAAYLWDTLEDKEYGPSYSPEKAPFAKALGMIIFRYYHDHPRGIHQTERFSEAMVGWGTVTGKGILPKIYPWTSLPKDTIINDVGGNNGHTMLELIKAYPDLKVVVQDLEIIRPRFEEFWSKERPQAVEQQRVEFVPIDFLKGPPVKNCDIYYIRHVLHDWPDAECVTILKNVRKAMKSSSRLLIHEFVLQAASRSSSDAAGNEDCAPEPLLPNYGLGRIRRYNQDINMMCALNGKERTSQEFIDLGTQAELKFVKLWESGETALVEFQL